MGTKRGPARTAVDEYARPYLPLVSKRCSDEGRRPCDYLLIVAKYSRDGNLVARCAADEILALAKTEARRVKMQRLLDRACEPTQLLVMVTAGDHIEGDLFRVPVVAPTPGAPRKFGVYPAELAQVNAYISKYGPAMLDTVEEFGDEIHEYVAIAKLPDGSPELVHRNHAATTLLAEGYSAVLGELEVPAKEDELLLFYMIAGHPTWSRLAFGGPPRAAPPPEPLEPEGGSFVALKQLMSRHAHFAVTKMLAAGQRLEEHLLYFGSTEEHPRVIERKRAREEFAGTIDEILLGDDLYPDALDKLLVLYPDGEQRKAWCFIVDREKRVEPAEKMPVDDETIASLKKNRVMRKRAIRNMQELLYPKVRALGPGGFLMFWALHEDKAPVLVVREKARAVLGSHPRWREILPHLFVPRDDVLMLVDTGAGDLIAFARERNEIRPPPPPWHP